MKWPAASTVRRALRREAVDGIIDTLRFRLDTFPRLDYQPLPWVGKPVAARGDGCASRWPEIERVVLEVHAESALDIGANVGWFVLRLAERGVYTVAVERVPKFYRPFLFAAQRSRRTNVALLTMNLDPQTARLLPQVDAILFLSVWHHLVREHGLEPATAALQEVWRASAKVMFFETGEDEMGKSWNLPEFRPSAREWIGDFLAATCEGSRVEHLGSHPAFDENGSPCVRNLFAVVRTS